DCRPVPRISEAKVETTMIASRPQRQESLEKPALAATRTPAAKTESDRQIIGGFPVAHDISNTQTKKRRDDAPLHQIIVNGLLGVRHARAPHIYAGKQEQPYNVNEVPVPGGKFEAEMLLRAKVAGHRAQQTDDQEDRADDDVGPVEARGHEES